MNRSLSARDIANLTDAAEKAQGSAYISKDSRTVPADNIIGMLSLRLQKGDEIFLFSAGGEKAAVVHRLLDSHHP